MWSWLHDEMYEMFGVMLTPASIFAFCDLLINTFFSLAFGRFGLRLKLSYRDQVTKGG